MKKILMIAFGMVLPIVCCAQDDDFGIWVEAAASKSFGTRWSVGLDAELRSEDNTSRIDRLSIGPSVGFKVCKYLKLGAGYNFMASYSPEKRKEHYKNDIVDDDHWNGYKLTDAYWTPRHRANVDVTGTIKFWKLLRISLRERYQFTYNDSVTVNETKYRYDKITDGNTGETVYELRDGYPIEELDGKQSVNTHILRSRLKIEIDKKHLKWSPFVSVEFHNNLQSNFHLDKLRTSVGTDYSINKHHKVGLSYILTHKFEDEGTSRMHAINASYKFNF